MTIETEISDFRSDDIVAGVPISIPMKVYSASHIFVRYSTGASLAVQGTDYTVTLQPDDYDTVVITPTASLITKIGVGDNFIVTSRTLAYTNDFTDNDAYIRRKIREQFDLTDMKLQQLATASTKAWSSIFGEIAGTIEIGDNGTAPIWLNGNLIKSDMNAAAIAAAAENAILAEQARVAAQLARDIAVAAAGSSFSNFYSREEAAAIPIPTLVESGPKMIRTASFYTGIRGGGATYFRTGVAGGPGSFQSADGQWWMLMEVNLNGLMFGAKNSTSFDSAQAIRDAFDYAAGLTVYFPVGQYLVNSAIVRTSPMNVRGDGTGAGPGSAAQSNDNCTQFLLNFANPSLFQVTSLFPSAFKDFQINVHPTYRTPGRGGTGISLLAPGVGTCTNCRIENVAFNWVARGVYMYKPGWNTIEYCYFDDWVGAAIFGETGIDTGTGLYVEGSCGYIQNNYFFGEPDMSQASCVHIKCGYTVISNNEMLGSQVGVRIDIANYNAGYIRVQDNTIEEQGLFGVYVVAPASGISVSLLNISRNEFAELFTGSTYASAVAIAERSTPWLDNVLIADNQTFLGGGSVTHFIIGSGSNLFLSRNSIRNYSGNSHQGYAVTGTVTNGALVHPLLVQNNTLVGVFGAFYNLANHSAVTFTTDYPIPIAYLPLYARHGSYAFISDGKCTNFLGGDLTLIGGGTGTPAWSRNGTWLAIFP